jgi:hypothetical protein
MPWSSPNAFEAFELVVGRRRRQHGGAGPLGELDGGDAHPPAPAWTSTDSPARVAELEEAVVGGTEGDRDAGREHDVEPVGHEPGRGGGAPTSSACDPCGTVSTTRWPDLAVGPPRHPTSRIVPAHW